MEKIEGTSSPETIKSNIETKNLHKTGYEYENDLLVAQSTYKDTYFEMPAMENWNDKDIPI